MPSSLPTGHLAHAQYPSFQSWEEAEFSLNQRLKAKEVNLENSRFLMEVLARFSDRCPFPSTLKATLAEIGDIRSQDHERLMNHLVLHRLTNWMEALAEQALRFSELCDSSRHQQVQLLDEWQSMIKTTPYAEISRRTFLMREIISPGIFEAVLPDTRLNAGTISQLREAVDNRECYRWLLKNYPACRQDIANYASLLIDSLPEEVTRIPLALLDQAMLSAAKEVHYSSLAYAKRLAEAVRSVVPIFVSSCGREGPAQELKSDGNENNPPYESLNALEQHERALQCIAQERRSSDHIRSILIPQLLEERAPLLESFWAIHAARFQDNPALAQNFGDTPFNVSNYVRLSSANGLYDSAVGTLRHVDVCCENSFLHLPHGHLALLEEKFFNALETALRNLPEGSPEQAINLVARAHLFLIVAHLPFDGSGRTNEDFLVYFAARAGLNLTLSNSGYRIELSPLVQRMEAAETAFKHEIDLRALQSFGIKAGQFNDESWMENLDRLLRLLDCNGDKALQVQKSLGSLRLITELQNGAAGTENMRKLFATFDAIRDIWADGCSEIYVTASPNFAKKIDLLTAQSLIEAPFVFREKLRGLRDELETESIGRIFLREHLSARASRFSSAKNMADFRDLRQAIEKEAQEILDRRKMDQLIENWPLILAESLGIEHLRAAG